MNIPTVAGNLRDQMVSVEVEGGLYILPVTEEELWAGTWSLLRVAELRMTPPIFPTDPRERWALLIDLAYRGTLAESVHNEREAREQADRLHQILTEPMIIFDTDTVTGDNTP